MHIFPIFSTFFDSFPENSTFLQQIAEALLLLLYLQKTKKARFTAFRNTSNAQLTFLCTAFGWRVRFSGGAWPAEWEMENFTSQTAAPAPRQTNHLFWKFPSLKIAFHGFSPNFHQPLNDKVFPIRKIFLKSCVFSFEI